MIRILTFNYDYNDQSTNQAHLKRLVCYSSDKGSNKNNYRLSRAGIKYLI